MGAAGQLVCPLVFKTSVRRVKRLGWVRFPHVSAKRIVRNNLFIKLEEEEKL